MRARLGIVVVAVGLACAGTPVARADRAPTASERTTLVRTIRSFLQRTSQGVPVGSVRISAVRVSSVSASWATARVRTKTLGDSRALLQRRGGRWRVNAIGMPPFDCDRTPQAVRDDLGVPCG